MGYSLLAARTHPKRWITGNTGTVEAQLIAFGACSACRNADPI